MIAGAIVRVRGQAPQLYYADIMKLYRARMAEAHRVLREGGVLLNQDGGRD